MMNYLNDFTNDFVEFEELPETILLEPEQCDQALELSKQVGHETRQWQIYFQVLALLSFEEWLQKREPEFVIERGECSVLQPGYANVIDVVCNLKIGEFKICLIPTLSFVNENVAIPRVVVDLPEFMAHFYVVIGINDELDIAAIIGFMRHDKLMNYHSQFQAEVDWNYQLPLAWFNRDDDELLLYLQCLDPIAIPLPEIPRNRQATLARMQPALLRLLPQLHNQPLWQVLTWEQGAAVLTTPDLLRWLYQSLAENTVTISNHLSDLLQILTQKSVNVRCWLHNQMDKVMQELSWEVLEVPSPLRGIEAVQELPVRLSLRRTEQNPSQDLEIILTEINRSHELKIPAIAARAYRDFNLEIRLRLYAITWDLLDNDGWILLLILKVISGNNSPHRMTLRVSDQMEVLAEESLQTDSINNYIFTQVEGSYKDKFMATITSATGETQALPPFEFSWE